MSEPAQLTIRPTSETRFDLLALGEVLLRFDPGETRIHTTRQFNVWEGGGEYNVARGLRRCFNLRTAIATALVDNPVGRLLEDLMLQGGVDPTHILWRPFDGIGREARNGVYFLERGFGPRRGLGTMDRGNTAISQLQPGDVDWHQIFATGGVRCFHTGGIMAALSASTTEVVREAMTAAKAHGTLISFDCNYRPSLWKSRNGRAGSIEVNRSLMPMVDILFGHEGDIARGLGDDLGAASLGPVWHNTDTFTAMAARVQADFPNLKVIATTTRKPLTATRNGWSAFASIAGEIYTGITFEDLEILDRVGGGDAFASGLLYGLLTNQPPQHTLNLAIAHGALTMSTPGDSSMATLPELESLLQNPTANTHR